MELGPNQQKWVSALRSGDFKQTREALGLKTEDGEKYCCLGVAEFLFGRVDRESSMGRIIFGDSDEYSEDVLTTKTMKKLGLKDHAGGWTWGSPHTLDKRDIGEVSAICLSQANDLGASFEEIADFIESNPSLVFKESK